MGAGGRKRPRKGEKAGSDRGRECQQEATVLARGGGGWGERACWRSWAREARP